MTSKPLPSPISAFGGKFRAVQEAHIQDFIMPCVGTTEYVEMFCFSATLFFNLNTRPRRAILNDADDRLMRFWRVIRDHCTEFEQELEYCWLAPSVFAEYKQRQDEIGQAVFFYLQNRNGWCGIRSESFHYNYRGHHIRKDLKPWAKMLNHGCVEMWNLDFREVFDRLDKAGGKEGHFCIYEDPPYFQQGERYDHRFTEQDHRDLAELNHATPHTVVLSYADHPLVRALYADWDVIELIYSHSQKSGNHGKDCEHAIGGEGKRELLLSNRPLRRWTSGTSDLTRWVKPTNQVEV